MKSRILVALCFVQYCFCVTLVLVSDIGAGKSFTGNILIGKFAFLSKLSSQSVTQYQKVESWANWFVADTPGVDETTNENLRVSKAGIAEVFSNSESQILCCVMGVADGGRLRKSDIEACDMVKTAYGLSPEATIAVVNKVNVRKEEESTYKAGLLSELQSALPWIATARVAFLPKLFGKTWSPDIFLKQDAVTFRLEMEALVESAVAKKHHLLSAMETPIEKSKRLEAEKRDSDEKARIAQLKLDRVNKMPIFEWYPATDKSGKTNELKGRVQKGECLHIHDCHFQNDYLCAKPPFSLREWRWSLHKAIPGMDCVQWWEDTSCWDDNFLCRPKDLPFQYNYRWSHFRAIPDMKCTHIYTPWVKYWDDNFFCVSL